MCTWSRLKRRWWIPAIVLPFIGWIVWSSLGIIQDRRERDRLGEANQRYVCQQINTRALEPLRGILEQAQTAALRNPLPPGLTDEQRAFYSEQRARADALYRTWLNLTAPIDCEVLK